MPVGRLILLGLLGLVVAEAAVFLLVAQLIGLVHGIVSAVRDLDLGRAGAGTDGQAARGPARRHVVAAGPRRSPRPRAVCLTMIGGMLLVLPGFLTDIAGLLLLVPAIQRRLIDAPQLRRNRPGGQVLELDPQPVARPARHKRRTNLKIGRTSADPATQDSPDRRILVPSGGRVLATRPQTAAAGRREQDI